jgi:hypothetical protein
MVAAAGAAGCGSEDGVVGGDCATGYTQCGLQCIDLETDPQNCGSCGAACPAGMGCSQGVCGGELDGSADGSGGDGAVCGDAKCPAGGDGGDGGDGSPNGSDATTDGSGEGGGEDGTAGDGPMTGDGAGEDGSGEDGSSSGGDGSSGGSDGSSSGGEDGSSGGSDGSSGGSDGSSGGSDGSSGGSDGSSSGGEDGSSGGSDGSSGGRDGSSGGSDGSSGGSDGSSGGSDGSSSGLGDGSTHEGGSGDACTPPFDTAENCGACGNKCTSPDDLCLLVDGGFRCAADCTPPLTACSGQCVNLSRDPNNCGMCGVVCPSQYCFLATCQGKLAGNIMVIGHDFQKTTPTEQQARLLTNSVFYNPGSVNLLSFEEYADAATVTNGLSILKGFATAEGVTLNVQSTKDPTAPANDTLLAGESAVLVWDQPNAPSGMLASLGTSWAPHLSKYLQGGGIVIVLNAAQGVAQMPALLNNAALLTVTGQGTYMAGNPAQDTGLSIARGILSVYEVDQNTAWFTTSEVQSGTTLYVANVLGEATELLAVQKVVN